MKNRPHLLISLLLTSPALAQWSFHLVADTNTPVPGRGGLFTRFYPPCVGQGHVLFSADNGYGEYTDLTGPLTRVVDETSTIPGTSSHFTSGFGAESFDGTRFSFSGGSSAAGFGGIYSSTGGPLDIPVDTNTPLPPAGASFSFPTLQTEFFRRRGDLAAFLTGPPGVLSGPAVALYGWTSGTYHRLLDTSTPMPGGGGNFQDLNYISLGATMAVISARDSTGARGVYTVPVSGGPITTVIDPNTPIPGGIGNFIGAGTVGADGANVVFTGGGATGPGGVYARIDGSLLRIADGNTAAPEGGQFYDFAGATPSISGHNILFEAASTARGRGLYVWRDGVISRVISESETLGGLFIGSLALSPEGIDGDTIAFSFSNFNPTTGAVYTATYIPSPAAIPVFGAAALLGARRRRR